MNRRDFIRQTVFTAIGLSLPVQLSATLTIIDIKILDTFTEAMTTTKSKEGLIAHLDVDTLWQHVRLIDDEGREWQTADSGQTWRHGLMEFSLDIAQG